MITILNLNICPSHVLNYMWIGLNNLHISIPWSKQQKQSKIVHLTKVKKLLSEEYTNRKNYSEEIILPYLSLLYQQELNGARNILKRFLVYKVGNVAVVGSP